jgi:bacillithiol system protein YtxJ
MGLFNFSKSSEKINWKRLESEEQLDELVGRSNEKPIALFKHSTRCGVSSFVKNGLESKWDIEENDLEMWYLDLLRYRNISNKIASDLGIYHESPQLILLKNGKVVYHDSHNSISVDQIKQALA